VAYFTILAQNVYWKRKPVLMMVGFWNENGTVNLPIVKQSVVHSASNFGLIREI
jgi:hypothetical protein